mmetsp:Transcript_24171/g.75921  ORF Transcript_24171/g.75921 Transcript_24171/m.75921 type:complete len:162 (-) Transcript_24171:271-756(-)
MVASMCPVPSDHRTGGEPLREAYPLKLPITRQRRGPAEGRHARPQPNSALAGINQMHGWLPPISAAWGALYTGLPPGPPARRHTGSPAASPPPPGTGQRQRQGRTRSGGTRTGTMQALVPHVHGAAARSASMQTAIMSEKSQQQPPRRGSTRCTVDSSWML